MSRHSRMWVLFATFAVAPGCRELAPASELAYERTIAIRAEVLTDDEGGAPPADPVYNDFLPGERGRLSVLDVGPEGVLEPDRVDRTWLACLRAPSESDLDCLREGLARNDDPDPCIEVDADVVAIPDALGQTCRPDVATETGEFVFPALESLAWGRALSVASIAGVDRSSRGCIEALGSRDYDLPDDCLYVTHELPLADFEKRGTNPTTGELVLHGVRGDEDDELTPTEQGRIVLESGAHLTLELAFSEEDAQTFAVPIAGGEPTSSLERLDTQWFATSGTFEKVEEEAFEARSTWIPDDDAEADDVHLFAVVRDGRWGTAWLELTVEVEP